MVAGTDHPLSHVQILQPFDAEVTVQYGYVDFVQCWLIGDSIWKCCADESIENEGCIMDLVSDFISSCHE